MGTPGLHGLLHTKSMADQRLCLASKGTERDINKLYETSGIVMGSVKEQGERTMDKEGHT